LRLVGTPSSLLIAHFNLGLFVGKRDGFLVSLFKLAIKFLISIFCSTPYDLAKHLTEAFYTNLHSAKWSERKDAIQDLINVMEKNPLLVPNEQELQKLIDDLSKVSLNS
jgi:hypothetical protein